LKLDEFFQFDIILNNIKNETLSIKKEDLQLDTAHIEQQTYRKTAHRR
jgi:hypothetical protein